MGAQNLLPGIRYQFGEMIDSRMPINLGKVIQQHWIVQSEPKIISSTVEAVEAALLTLPLDPQRLSDFILAVSELIQNPFLHAPENSGKYIEVCMLYVPGVGVFVGVSDELGAVDPDIFTHDISEVEVMAEHGRGIPLMRAFSSLLLYTQDGEWKEIILGLSAA